MGSNCAPYRVLLLFFTGFCALCQCSAELHADQTALLFVNASEASARKIPKTLFGLFFEVSLVIYNGELLIYLFEFN